MNNLTIVNHFLWLIYQPVCFINSEQPGISEQFCDGQKVPYHQVWPAKSTYICNTPVCIQIPKLCLKKDTKFDQFLKNLGIMCNQYPKITKEPHKLPWPFNKNLMKNQTNPNKSQTNHKQIQMKVTKIWNAVFPTIVNF